MTGAGATKGWGVPAFDGLAREADAALAAGKLGLAESKFRAAIMWCKGARVQDRRLVRAYEGLAATFREQDRIPEAEDAERKAGEVEGLS